MTTKKATVKKAAVGRTAHKKTSPTPQPTAAQSRLPSASAAFGRTARKATDEQLRDVLTTPFAGDGLDDIRQSVARGEIERREREGPPENPAPPAKAVIEDTAHSISPEQAEQIAERRVTHDDERPPTKLDVPELFSRAWDAIKGESDPPLNQCAPSHVDKVYSHGQRILAGNSPQEGNTQLARFEQKVFELMKDS